MIANDRLMEELKYVKATKMRLVVSYHGYHIRNTEVLKRQLVDFVVELVVRVAVVVVVLRMIHHTVVGVVGLVVDHNVLVVAPVAFVVRVAVVVVVLRLIHHTVVGVVGQVVVVVVPVVML